MPVRPQPTDGEVVALNLADYQPKRRALVIRQGKRLGERIVARGNWPGPLWCAISKAKQVITRRLSEQVVLFVRSAIVVLFFFTLMLRIARLRAAVPIALSFAGFLVSQMLLSVSAPAFLDQARCR